MKKSAIIIVLIITIVACKPKKTKDFIIFSGRIKNMESGQIKLLNISRTFQKEIFLNSDNSFIDTLEIESGFYSFRDGKRHINLYLVKGQDLKLSYDLRDITNTINFEGINGKTNNYLFKKDAKQRELIGNEEILYSLSENDFISKMKNIETQLKELAENSKLEASFLKQELKNIHYDYILNIINYEEYHQYYTKDVAFVVSNSFPSGTSNFDFNNEIDYKSSHAYKYILHDVFLKLTEEKQKETKGEELLTLINIINSKITNKFIKEEYLFNSVISKIAYTNNLKNVYTKFISLSTNDKHKKEITKVYNDLKAIAKGEPSPKFVNYENYKGGTTSLDDLKGKYVYIDVWASWCAPCKAEIPHLKKIEKQYHDKNIVFVSISIDNEKNRKSWKKIVAEKDMRGIQLLADKDWNSDFINSYNIKGIPRFILIDTDGKIVKADAPRPSNPKLIELFNELGI
jgi:thiol-disulfide isomerase/thioredoxin